MKQNPFLITTEEQNGYSLLIIKNLLTNEYLSVIPELGARLKDLFLRSGENIISLLRSYDPAKLESRDDLFTNAKLFPFAGRIKNGKYVFENKEYILPINYPEENNACHGFVFDKKFDLVNTIINEEYGACTFRYYYNYFQAGYPFKTEIEITYKLAIKDGLTCETKIINNSDSSIPVMDGWHHYFELGCPVDNLKMRIEPSELISVDLQNIPNGKTKIFDEFSSLTRIDGKHFDNCFKLNCGNGRVTTQIFSEEHNTQLNIWQETGMNKYNYVVIYTPADRKSIAIEPMTSNVNSFNNHEGLIVLAPCEELEMNYGIYID